MLLPPQEVQREPQKPRRRRSATSCCATSEGTAGSAMNSMGWGIGFAWECVLAVHSTRANGPGRDCAGTAPFEVDANIQGPRHRRCTAKVASGAAVARERFCLTSNAGPPPLLAQAPKRSSLARGRRAPHLRNTTSIHPLWHRIHSQSFMMVKICFFVQPPPKPSSVSQSPSSWKHQASQSVPAPDTAAATSGGQRAFAASKKRWPHTNQGAQERKVGEWRIR